MQIHIGIILGEFNKGTIYKGLGSILGDLKRRNSSDTWTLTAPGLAGRGEQVVSQESWNLEAERAV